ncbi:hypothetical protein [[Acholeplasma] multilocale]|uniref:hypothetical protein n=1 Tax=[Acholeplasma] multilocale TaxID=264638 RepID=UPI00047883DC|nr:hypothetical protein [[Acholeplasma] multilocale]
MSKFNKIMAVTAAIALSATAIVGSVMVINSLKVENKDLKNALQILKRENQKLTQQIEDLDSELKETKQRLENILLALQKIQQNLINASQNIADSIQLFGSEASKQWLADNPAPTQRKDIDVNSLIKLSEWILEGTNQIKNSSGEQTTALDSILEKLGATDEEIANTEQDNGKKLELIDQKIQEQNQLIQKLTNERKILLDTLAKIVISTYGIIDEILNQGQKSELVEKVIQLIKMNEIDTSNISEKIDEIIANEELSIDEKITSLDEINQEAINKVNEFTNTLNQELILLEDEKEQLLDLIAKAEKALGEINQFVDQQINKIIEDIENIIGI